MELVGLDAYEQKTGRRVVRRNKDHFRQQFGSGEGSFCIAGRVDGFEEQGGQRWVVEHKRRQRCLFDAVPRYEEVQCQTYMVLTSTSACRWVQTIGPNVDCRSLARCAQRWQCIRSRLRASAVLLHLLVSGALRPGVQELEALQKEAWSKAPPWPGGSPPTPDGAAEALPMQMVESSLEATPPRVAAFNSSTRPLYDGVARKLYADADEAAGEFPKPLAVGFGAGAKQLGVEVGVDVRSGGDAGGVAGRQPNQDAEEIVAERSPMPAVGFGIDAKLPNAAVDDVAPRQSVRTDVMPEVVPATGQVLAAAGLPQLSPSAACYEPVVQSTPTFERPLFGPCHAASFGEASATVLEDDLASMPAFASGLPVPLEAERCHFIALANAPTLEETVLEPTLLQAAIAEGVPPLPPPPGSPAASSPVAPTEVDEDSEVEGGGIAGCCIVIEATQ